MKTQALLIMIILSGISYASFGQWYYLPDTVWLKTGEIIPCKIASINAEENTLTLQYYNEGVLAYRPEELDNVRTYVIGPKELYNTATDTSIAVEDIPDPLKSTKIYFGFGGGVPKNLGVSFTLILKNDWGASLGIKYVSYDRLDRSGNTGGMFGPGVIPGDELVEYYVCAVREFPSQHTKRVRFGIEAGLALVKYEKVLSSEIRSVWIFGRYYSAKTEEYITGGLTLRGKLEFPVSLALGFELGLYANINPEKPHAGFDLYLTLGKVRDRLSPRVKL